MAGMMRITLAALAVALAFGPATAQEEEEAAGHGVEVEAQEWSWDGLFGGFDQTQLQRGYLVYEQVCSNCHSLDLVAFRNLAGLGFNEEQIAAIAANYPRPVTDIDQETGEATTRPARDEDYFPAPFANPTAARFSNSGAMPPDLSVIVKAREAGPDHIYGILTGYQDPPEGVTVPDGKYYNAAFPGHIISMSPPLLDGSVQYIDDTPNTLDQMARDVTAFLTWASEPSLVERKELGVKVILFLIVFAGIVYAVKRKIWSDVEH
jgi:ubiquinol-cytochrome c reductase cytochrome c1 subunit